MTFSYFMMPGSKGLNPHELAHKWVKDLGTRPNMSLKVGWPSHDMRIIGRIVGVQSTEQSAGIIVGAFDSNIILFISSIITSTFLFQCLIPINKIYFFILNFAIIWHCDFIFIIFNFYIDICIIKWYIIVKQKKKLKIKKLEIRKEDKPPGT